MKKFLLFVALTIAAFAAGIIDDVKGEVVIQRKGEWIIARESMPFEAKDFFDVKANSRAKLKFDDGTRVTLGSNAQFSVDSYFYDKENPNKSNATFSVARGAFKTVTGQIAKIAPDKFALKTKTATIGVRGTIFYGLISPNGRDRFSCENGQVSVTATNGASVSLNANEMTTVAPNSAPSKPEKANWELFELAGDFNYLLFGAIVAIVVAVAIGAFFILRKKRSRKRK
jgi:hypothetical protein